MICDLKKARGRGPKEDTDARRGRLGTFWSKYHNTHKTIDLRLASTGGGHLPLGTGIGGNYFAGPETQTSSAQARLDQWKLRPSMGKRPYPGTVPVADEKDAESDADAPNVEEQRPPGSANRRGTTFHR